MVNQMSPLKRWLLSRDESLVSFAHRTHITYKTLYKVYQGKPVRIDTAKKIVKYSKNQLTLKENNESTFPRTYFIELDNLYDSKNTGLPEGK